MAPPDAWVPLLHIWHRELPAVAANVPGAHALQSAEPLSEEECDAALKMAIAATKAASVKDMGKVMAYLRGEYAGRMDFSTVSQLVKTRLMG